MSYYKKCSLDEWADAHRARYEAYKRQEQIRIARQYNIATVADDEPEEPEYQAPPCETNNYLNTRYMLGCTMDEANEIISAGERPIPIWGRYSDGIIRETCFDAWLLKLGATIRDANGTICTRTEHGFKKKRFLF